MKRYTVIEKPLFLKNGILALTQEQAEPRKHLLKHLRGDQYEIIGEVCFKIGEEIGFDGPVKHHINLERVKTKVAKSETEVAKSETNK